MYNHVFFMQQMVKNIWLDVEFMLRHPDWRNTEDHISRTMTCVCGCSGFFSISYILGLWNMNHINFHYNLINPQLLIVFHFFSLQIFFLRLPLWKKPYFVYRVRTYHRSVCPLNKILWAGHKLHLAFVSVGQKFILQTTGCLVGQTTMYLVSLESF